MSEQQIQGPTGNQYNNVAGSYQSLVPGATAGVNGLSQNTASGVSSLTALLNNNPYQNGAQTGSSSKARNTALARWPRSSRPLPARTSPRGQPPAVMSRRLWRRALTRRTSFTSSSSSRIRTRPMPLIP